MQGGLCWEESWHFLSGAPGLWSAQALVKLLWASPPLPPTTGHMVKGRFLLPFCALISRLQGSSPSQSGAAGGHWGWDLGPQGRLSTEWAGHQDT